MQFGATNTAVLICSSLTMALAIRAAQTGKSKCTIIFYLILTMILGAAFIGLKLGSNGTTITWKALFPGFSWTYNGPNAPGVQMFMCFYFFMTGLHAMHMVVGLGILMVLTVMTARGRFSPQYYAPLEISGLVLALCRYCVDLFVPASVFDWRALQHGRPLMADPAEHVGAYRTRGSGKRLRGSVSRADDRNGADHGRGLHRSRALEYCRGAGDRRHQDAARGSVLHAREVQPGLTRIVIVGAFFWLGIMICFSHVR